MKRLLAPAAAAAATLVLAACGGGGGSSDSADSSAAPSNGTAVSVKSVDGMSNVLVDSDGKALYASDVEANGKVACTGGCESFWKPLTTDTAKPTVSSDAGTASVVKRPDGKMQVAVAGKLLYTFSEDSPGKISGDGFADDFDGQHFTWHTVLAGGKISTGSGSDSGDDSGAPAGKGDYGY